MRVTAALYAASELITASARLLQSTALLPTDRCHINPPPVKNLPLTCDAQNAAARLVTRLGPRDHFSNALRSLHWLPVQERITYKLCLLMHLVHNNRAPSYLSDSVTATDNLSRRARIRSASSLCYEQPRTRLKLGERSFTFAGPVAWNTLLSSVQELSDTESFNRHLKTVLFQRCYCCSTSF